MTRRPDPHHGPWPIVRAALKRGAIVPAGPHYGFGRRRFNRATINRLLASGEALRLEDGRVISRAALPMVIPGATS